MPAQPLPIGAFGMGKDVTKVIFFSLKMQPLADKTLFKVSI